MRDTRLAALLTAIMEQTLPLTNPRSEIEARVSLERRAQAVDAIHQLFHDMQEEIKVDRVLLADKKRLLDEIPGCEVHGDDCVPHAIDWVRERKTERAALLERIRSAEVDRDYWKKAHEKLLDQFCNAVRAEQTVARASNKELCDLRAKLRGEVWHWEAEGENNLESITCPILIRAQALRDLLENAKRSAREELDARVTRAEETMRVLYQEVERRSGKPFPGPPDYKFNVGDAVLAANAIKAKVVARFMDGKPYFVVAIVAPTPSQLVLAHLYAVYTTDELTLDDEAT